MTIRRRSAIPTTTMISTTTTRMTRTRTRTRSGRVRGSRRVAVSGDAMDLPRNAFKHALAEGRQQIGLWCSLSHHYGLEAVAGSGFDWLLLDTEHSPNDLE